MASNIIQTAYRYKIMFMKTQFTDSSIEIETTQNNDGLWTAVVQIRPIDNAVIALRAQRELEGYKNQEEAEDAAMQWAKDRIEAYAVNRRLMQQ